MTDEPRLIGLLVCEVQGQLCGLPIEHIGETLRCPQLTRLADAPSHVLGMARVRGQSLVVMDLGLLLGGSASRCTRLVTLRRAVPAAPMPACALAVDSVEGIRQLPAASVQALPTLARRAEGSLIQGTSAQARALVTVLDAIRLMDLAGQTPLPHGEPS